MVDGNYRGHGILDIVWQHANTVVWVDPPRSVVMRRVLWRTLRRGFQGETLWNGNRERLLSLLRLTPEENIVLWAATRFDRTRRNYSERTSDPAWAHLTIHRLRHAREQRTLLATLGANA